MQVYLVGGAVRDELLGLPVRERDWVVVGATPEQMQDLGYRAVGRDFPVFLHPESQEEYALARLERKTGPGYRGFVTEHSPAVTLEEDLVRRDLTVNAIARDAEGRLVDPCGGQQDLAARLLRHVSPAFGEDPVRILRVARFAARFAPLGFRVAPETMALMQKMVGDGEASALVPERVWQELVRALAEPAPTRFFGVLRDCGALAVIMPEIDDLLEADAARVAGGTQALGNPLADELSPGGKSAAAAPEPASLDVLRLAAALQAAPPVRFAAFLAALDANSAAALCERLRAPVEYRDLLRLAITLAALLRGGPQPPALAARDPDWLMGLYERADAFRRAPRFAEWLEVLKVRSLAAGVPEPEVSALAARLASGLARASAAQLPAGSTASGPAYGAALRAARLAALAAPNGSSGPTDAPAS